MSTETLTREELETQYLSLPGNDTLTSAGWLRNGRLKLTNAAGEAVFKTRSELETLLSTEAPKRKAKASVADEAVAAAAPDGVAETLTEAPTPTSPPSETKGSLKEYSVPILRAVRERLKADGHDAYDPKASVMLANIFGSTKDANDTLRKFKAEGATTSDAAANILAGLGVEVEMEQEFSKTKQAKGKGKGKGAKTSGAKTSGAKTKAQKPAKEKKEAPVATGASKTSLKKIEGLATRFRDEHRRENSGTLTKGEVLYNLDQLANDMRERKEVLKQSEVVTMAAEIFAKNDIPLPSKPVRSQLRGTYSAWVIDAGADLATDYPLQRSDGSVIPVTPDSDQARTLRLTDVADFKNLYSTKDLVTPDTIGMVLGFIDLMGSNHNISQVAPLLNPNSFEGIYEKLESMNSDERMAWVAAQRGIKTGEIGEMKSIRTEKAVYDTFMEFKDGRLLEVYLQAVPSKLTDPENPKAEPSLSNAVALVWLMDLVQYVGDEQLVFVTKDMAGQLTEEDRAEWQALLGGEVEEVEDDEDEDDDEDDGDEGDEDVDDEDVDDEDVDDDDEIDL